MLPNLAELIDINTSTRENKPSNLTHMQAKPNQNQTALLQQTWILPKTFQKSQSLFQSVLGVPLLAFPLPQVWWTPTENHGSRSTN